MLVGDASSAYKIVACTCKGRLFVEYLEFRNSSSVKFLKLRVSISVQGKGGYLSYFGFAASNYFPAEDLKYWSLA